MTAEDELQDLLERAREAPPSTRIDLRDAVAAFGPAAIPAMAEWLTDDALARFAVRVLERIGRDPALLQSVAAALHGAREMPAADKADIEAALVRLGALAVRPARSSRPRAARTSTAASHGLAGVDGRGYWAMRTSPKYPEFIWAEVRRGRLRQGWGWEAEQDLRLIAEHVRIGRQLTEVEGLAWRARRMLSTQPDGMHTGDLVVTQNLPRPGRLSVCRVVGAYEWDLPANPVDFGHVLPVELVVEDVGRFDGPVSDALRRAVSLMPRLYSITPYGGDVEALVAATLAARQ